MNLNPSQNAYSDGENSDDLSDDQEITSASNLDPNKVGEEQLIRFTAADKIDDDGFEHI